jgi:hypothetical protein
MFEKNLRARHATVVMGNTATTGAGAEVPARSSDTDRAEALCRITSLAIQQAATAHQAFGATMRTEAMEGFMARNTFPERYERFETLMLNFVNLGVLVGDTPVLHKAIECVRANPSTRNRFNLVYVMFGCMAEQDMKALTQLVEYMAEHEASLAPGTRSLNLLALLLWLKNSPNAEAPALVVRILDMLRAQPNFCTSAQYSVAFVEAANKGYRDVADVIYALATTAPSAVRVQLSDTENALEGICRHGFTFLLPAVNVAKAKTKGIIPTCLAVALHNHHYDTALALKEDMDKDDTSTLSGLLFAPGSDMAFMSDPESVHWILDADILVPEQVLWQAWAARGAGPVNATIAADIEGRPGLLDIPFATVLHKIKDGGVLDSADYSVLNSKTDEANATHVQAQAKILEAVMQRAASGDSDWKSAIKNLDKLFPLEYSVYANLFFKKIINSTPSLTLTTIMGAWEVLKEGTEEPEPYAALDVLSAVLKRLVSDSDVVAWVAKERAAAAARKHTDRIPSDILFTIKERLSTQPRVLAWANTYKPGSPVPEDVLDTIVRQLSPPVNPLGGTAGMQAFVAGWWAQAHWELSDAFWEELVDVLVYVSSLDWSVFVADVWDAVLAGFQTRSRGMTDEKFRALLQRTAAKRHYDGVCLQRMGIVATPPGAAPDPNRIRALISTPREGTELILEPIPARDFRNTFKKKSLSKRRGMTLPVFQCLVTKLEGIPGVSIDENELFSQCVRSAAVDPPVSNDLIQKAAWLLDTYGEDITISRYDFNTVLKFPAKHVQFLLAVLQHVLASPAGDGSSLLDIGHAWEWMSMANDIDAVLCASSPTAQDQLCLLQILSKEHTPAHDADVEAASMGFTLMLDSKPDLLRQLERRGGALYPVYTHMLKPAMHGIATTVMMRWALATGFARILTAQQRDAAQEWQAAQDAEAASAERAALIQRVREEAQAQDAARVRQFQRERGADTEEQARALLRHDADAATQVIADELTKRVHTYELNWDHPDVYDEAPRFHPSEYSTTEYSTRKAAYMQARTEYMEAKRAFEDRVKDVVTEYPPPRRQLDEYRDELVVLQTAVARLRTALLNFYGYQEHHNMLEDRTTRRQNAVLPWVKEQQLQLAQDPGRAAVGERWLGTGRDTETGAEVFRGLPMAPLLPTPLEVATDVTLGKLSAMTARELEDAAAAAEVYAQQARRRQTGAAAASLRRPRAFSGPADPDAYDAYVIRERLGDVEADAEAETLGRSRIHSFAEEDDARFAPRARTESYNEIYEEDEGSRDSGDGSPPYL